MSNYTKSEIFNPQPIPDSAYSSDAALWQYTLGDYSPVIQVLYNGSWETLPVSATGLSFVVSSMVTEGRNAQGTFVGEQVGRDQNKFDNLVFPMLYAHEWTRILRMLKIGTATYFRYYDLASGAQVIRTLYPGDRTATVYAYRTEILSGENVLRPEILSNCSVNLIDRGE